jgi:hypothetical protein
MQPPVEKKLSCTVNSRVPRSPLLPHLFTHTFKLCLFLMLIPPALQIEIRGIFSSIAPASRALQHRLRLFPHRCLVLAPQIHRR